jgi:hypothetical protein
MGWIGGWNCNPATIDQWPGPPGNITLLVGGAAPLVNDGIAGWTGTDPYRLYIRLRVQRLFSYSFLSSLALDSCIQNYQLCRLSPVECHEA